MSPLLSEQQLAQRYEFAKSLAQKAGDHALRLQQSAGHKGLSVASKGLQDFVTNADRECEDLIRASISETFPNDGFLGEESGGDIGGGPIWVVDPIDGTNNYMRGLPNWGVSIALVADGKIVLGAIYDATTQSLFHARKGQGAFRGDEQIHASTNSNPKTALAITGHSRRTPIAPYLQLLFDLHELGFDHRRPGAAALGLLRVAEGKAELFFEAHLNSWDVMAGVLIAGEAGAFTAHPDLPELLPRGGAVWASAWALRSTVEGLQEKYCPSDAAGISKRNAAHLASED